MKKSLICIFFTLFLLSCENPMYKDVVTEADLEIILQEKFPGLITVVAPSGKPIYIEFIKEEPKFKLHTDPTSKDWHLSSADTTWRFSSNSGTTADEVNSAGKGGVKVFSIAFAELIDSKQTVGMLNSDRDWETDKLLKYGDRELNLNYYLTKNLSNTQRPTPSETYLFDFESSNMTAGQTAYVAGTDYTFLIKDGNGGNYVKVQPMKISTDGSGMTFNNRIYQFNFEMADKDGNFKGVSGS